MYRDNQGAILLAGNPLLYKRSKHINICFYFQRDLIEKGDIQIDYIHITEIVANGFTKPLARVAFKRWVKMLGIT